MMDALRLPSRITLHADAGALADVEATLRDLEERIRHVRRLLDRDEDRAAASSMFKVARLSGEFALALDLSQP